MLESFILSFKKLPAAKFLQRHQLGLPIEQYRHLGRDDRVPVKFGPKGTDPQ